MKPSTKMLARAARLRLSRASASCQSERPAISSSAGEPWASSVIADLRIEHAVGEVDQEIEQDDERAVEDHHTHHQRVVAIERTLNEIPADAGDAEDGLDHHRARDNAGDRGS